MGATNEKAMRRRLSRKAHEGMTLIEIMIVVIIMALIATAVAVAVLPQFIKGKEKITEANVAQIRSAVISYMMDDGDGCPNVEQLIDFGELDETANPQDPWGNAYSVECAGTSIVVTSAGNDGQMGTEDDITTARRQAQ